MKSNEFLVERVVNATDLSSKQKYGDELWNILQRSYKKVGGFKTAASIEELIEKSTLWKLVVRDGHVTAALIYKDQNGRKMVAAGTNGSLQGKKDYLMIQQDDVRLKRAWAEVSGPIESMLVKSGAKPLPNKFANILTGKNVLSYNEDGIHYTRMIGGHPHEKVIYGTINPSRELLDYLNLHGIQT